MSVAAEQSVAELVAFALFDLDPRVRDAQRPLHSFLISLALLPVDHAIDSDDLFSRVRALLPHGSNLSTEQLQLALDLNLKFDLIIQTQDGLALSTLRRTQLDEAQQLLEAERKSFHEHMRAAVEDKGAALDADEALQLEGLLEAQVQELLQRHSALIAAAWAGEAGFDAGVPGVNARDHLKEVANKLAPGGAQPNHLRRGVIVAGLDDGLRELPSEAARYLAALYQRTVAFALLRQDPTIQQVKAMLAGARVAYLDANVVLGAMFAADGEHSVSTQVIEVTRSLEASLRVTRFTLDEIQAKLTEACTWMRRYRGDISLLAAVDDVVLRSYHKSAGATPGLEWAAFIGSFDPPATWLQEYGIAVEDAECDQTELDERAEVVVASVAKHKNHPSSIVVKTDAHNLLHVDRRRTEVPGDEMGNRVWHVTHERGLVRAERELVKEGVLGGGVSRLAADWIDLLSPCLPPEETSLSDYVAHLVKSQFGLLAEDPMFIEKGFLMTLTSSRFAVAEVLEASPPRARQILVRLQADRELRELLDDPQPDDDTWTKQIERVVQKALNEVDQLPDADEALARERAARLEAERRADDEHRGRVQAVRELAEVREQVATLSEGAAAADAERAAIEAALQAERERSWWRKLLGR